MKNREEVMTQPETPNPLYDLQAIAAKNYLALLNEISSMGMPGFMALLDAATEDELRALLVACNVVYQQIQKFKGISTAG
jgi:hypothetical protein